MKKVLAILLAVLMAFSVMAVTASAAGTDVAAIGEATYATLADAITASSAGDTITLLDDVTENVTISKDITLDGAGKTYTGKITLSKTGATIQNVNFVNSHIFKKNEGAVAGTVTIKNCSFKGSIANDKYSIEIRLANKLVVENCSAENVGFGFIYVPTTVNNISVKNVDIDSATYGIHIAYNTASTIENVTIKNAYVGVMDQTYGAKTITFINCDIEATNPIAIWERNATTQTFKFEGDNEFVAPEGGKWLSSAKYCVIDAMCNVDTDSNVFEFVHTPGEAANCQAAQTCTVCGTELDAIKEHQLGEYVSNDDATCKTDGTKTAKCIYDCGLEVTVNDEGTIREHTDADGDKHCEYCTGEFCDLCGGLHYNALANWMCILTNLLRLLMSFLATLK